MDRRPTKHLPGQRHLRRLAGHSHPIFARLGDAVELAAEARCLGALLCAIRDQIKLELDDPALRPSNQIAPASRPA